MKIFDGDNYIYQIVIVIQLTESETPQKPYNNDTFW